MILFASLIIFLTAVLVLTSMDISINPMRFIHNRKIKMLKEEIQVLKISISVINGLGEGLSINSSLIAKRM